MKAIASCSGGVMFVPETIERRTNKQKSQSYKDIAGEDKKPSSLRDKIFGVVFKNNKQSNVA